MKSKILILLAIVAFLCQCSDNFSESDNLVSEVKTNEELAFSEDINLLGKSIAKSLRFIYVKMAENDTVDFSNQESVNILMEHYSKEYLEVMKIRKDTVNFDLSLEKAINGLRSLTDAQKKILSLISEAKQKSRSREDFLASLLDINQYMKKNISIIEQKRLSIVIAATYYSLKEIITLETEGYVLGRSYYIPPIKTRAFENGPTNGSIVSWCNSGISVVWLAAEAEPSPLGEIIATGVTVIWAGQKLYEFAVSCFSNFNKLTKDDCIELYDECVNIVKLKDRECTNCLHSCVSGGQWNCTRVPQYH